METRRPLQPMATGFDAPAVAASSTFMQAHPPDPAPRARADGLPTRRAEWLLDRRGAKGTVGERDVEMRFQ